MFTVFKAYKWYNEATRERPHTQPYNDVMNTQTEELVKRLELHIFDFSEHDHCNSGLQCCISTSKNILYWKIVHFHINHLLVKV